MKTYPLTAKYDKEWVIENWMGPNPLILLEELCGHLELKPGMKVLDMGCGKGLTSVFLAKEFGVTVFANDLWISATENLKRFEEAGVSDLVFPIQAEAHALPYAKEFFDVAIAIDSYHYYGADDWYFPGVFSKLVKPGGQFGVAVPGLAKEHEKGYPETMAKFWIGEPEMFCFHSGAWWRHLWEKTGIVDITACYDIENPKGIWRSWADWADENMHIFRDNDNIDIGEPKFTDNEFLDADTNDDLALIVMAAVKKR
jgi:SAM-dependent methyltransferase